MSRFAELVAIERPEQRRLFGSEGGEQRRGVEIGVVERGARSRNIGEVDAAGAAQRPGPVPW